MSIPICCSWLSTSTSIDCVARNKATPPPGTIPSACADWTASSASSMRCFFSIISISVAAPTRMMAMPEDNRVMRCCNCSQACIESVMASSLFREPIRLSMSSCFPLPPMKVELYLSPVYFFAIPRCSSLTSATFKPTLRDT